MVSLYMLTYPANLINTLLVFVNLDGTWWLRWFYGNVHQYVAARANPEFMFPQSYFYLLKFMVFARFFTKFVVLKWFWDIRALEKSKRETKWVQAKLHQMKKDEMKQELSELDYENYHLQDYLEQTDVHLNKKEKKDIAVNQEKANIIQAQMAMEYPDRDSQQKQLGAEKNEGKSDSDKNKDKATQIGVQNRDKKKFVLTKDDHEELLNLYDNHKKYLKWLEKKEVIEFEAEEDLQKKEEKSDDSDDSEGEKTDRSSDQKGTNEKENTKDVKESQKKAKKAPKKKTPSNKNSRLYGNLLLYSIGLHHYYFLYTFVFIFATAGSRQPSQDSGLSHLWILERIYITIDILTILVVQSFLYSKYKQLVAYNTLKISAARNGFESLTPEVQRRQAEGRVIYDRKPNELSKLEAKVDMDSVLCFCFGLKELRDLQEIPTSLKDNIYYIFWLIISFGLKQFQTIMVLGNMTLWTVHFLSSCYRMDLLRFTLGFLIFLFYACLLFLSVAKTSDTSEKGKNQMAIVGMMDVAEYCLYGVMIVCLITLIYHDIMKRCTTVRKVDSLSKLNDILRVQLDVIAMNKVKKLRKEGLKKQMKARKKEKKDQMKKNAKDLLM